MQNQQYRKIVFLCPFCIGDFISVRVFLLIRFLQDIGGSSYLSIVTQYPDNTVGSPSRTLSFGGSFNDITPYPSNIVTDSEIHNEIIHAMNVNSWSAGPNVEFFIFTAENVMPQVFESGACAYHSSFTDPNNGESVIYANMPDFFSISSSTATCNAKYSFLFPITPNFDSWADSEISLTSHELFESITDPYVTAWRNSTGSEIGDICAWQFGSQIGNPILEPNADVELNGHYYIVQEEWSNSANTCMLTGPSTFFDIINLHSVASSNPISTQNYFPITYTIGGQSFVFHDSGGTVTITTDPFSTVTIGSMTPYPPIKLARFGVLTPLAIPTLSLLWSTYSHSNITTCSRNMPLILCQMGQ